MNIYESIANIMMDVPAIGKEKKSDQGFKYRGIDQVMNVFQPILAKNKVFIIPQVLEQTREERKSSKGNTLIYSILKVKFSFYAEDGTSVDAITIGEGMDSGDKASNKAMAVAMKYAMFQTFCIPVDEMIDPDSEVHELAPKTITAAEAEKFLADLHGKGYTTVQIENALAKYRVTEAANLTEQQLNELRKKAGV